MLQLYPVYLLCNRRKTLTESPDPTHANGTNKPCIIGTAIKMEEEAKLKTEPLVNTHCADRS